MVLEISVWFVKFFSFHLGFIDVACACMQFYGDCELDIGKLSWVFISYFKF